ncbi:MAG: hypothetical protein GX640_16485 [Fibrobacter sp.]|nr:hypothetical protein [Fibrobacter sp.]
MSDAIYLIQDNGELIEMRENPYESEKILQELLARYPNLLAGEQIDSLEPRRWLLITREMGITDDENASARWSADHLFLDQDGIPTIVETKRGDDTRIRREVVGQMLDYAANAIAYWHVESIIAKFQLRCENEGVDSDIVLSEFLNDEISEQSFWEQTKTNLQAGKVRLVWVSDRIPKELRQVIEFLNKQMNPAQAIGIEIKMFAGQGLKTMVPRVLNTQKQEGTSSATGKKWTEEEFFKTLEERKGEDYCEIARTIFKWSQRHNLRITWGSGKKNGSFFPVLDHKGIEYFPLIVSTNGKVTIQFAVLKARPVFQEETKRIELLNRLNQIPGIDLSTDSIEKLNNPISMEVLKNSTVLEQFLDVFNWVFDEIRSH